VLVSPLLLEARQDTLANRVLVVDTEKGCNSNAPMKRDGNSSEQVRSIMEAQMDREARRARADDVIANNGTLAQLHAAVERCTRATSCSRPSTERASRPWRRPEPWHYRSIVRTAR
jgi:dephospho-CoA kinase